MDNSKGVVVAHSGSDKTVGAFRPRNSENLLTEQTGHHKRTDQGKPATLTARDDVNKSLSSNQINALDADSEKDYIYTNQGGV